MSVSVLNTPSEVFLLSYVSVVSFWLVRHGFFTKTHTFAKRTLRTRTPPRARTCVRLPNQQSPNAWQEQDHPPTHKLPSANRRRVEEERNDRMESTRLMSLDADPDGTEIVALFTHCDTDALTVAINRDRTGYTFRIKGRRNHFTISDGEALELARTILQRVLGDAEARS